MAKRFGKIIFILLITISCVKVPTGKTKWNIHWDKEGAHEKQMYLERVSRLKMKTDAPNIVLIVADDLGKNELSCYGAKDISTPHIDRLADEGVKFLNGYVTAPVCSSSRAGLLTGRYQESFGFDTQVMEFYPSNILEYSLGKRNSDLGDWRLSSVPEYPREWQVQKQGIPPSELNIAELLKAIGYHTAALGKWHLGTGKEHLPTNRGFDYHYGFLGAHSIYTPSRKTKGYINYIQDDFSSVYQWKLGRKSTAAIREQGKKIREKDYLTFAIRDKAINYIKKNHEAPFFLYVAFNAPHVPFQAPVDYYNRFAHIDNENRRVYLAMIAALDDAIGAINLAVEDAGLSENTLIFFISDNGGASYTGATDNGLLKGGKLTPFEGGINVPFIIKWPRRIPKGKIYNKAVSSLDIFASVTSVVQDGLPEYLPLDGINLFPLISGSSDVIPHPELFWKYGQVMAIRKGRWKLIVHERDNWMELYDLENDFSEKYDLSVKKKFVKGELYQVLDDWKEKLPPPLWPWLMERKFVIDGKTYYFPA